MKKVTWKVSQMEILITNNPMDLEVGITSEYMGIKQREPTSKYDQ